MRMLVCGGRDFADAAFVFRCLDAAHAKKPIKLIIHGAAQGADLLAQAWALEREIPYLGFPARWSEHGRAAGPKRNAAMLECTEIHGVTAFPGGRGTADMVSRAKAAGIPVWEPKP